MKCVDCGTEFEIEKKEKEIKVTLDNPGVVLVKGKIVECPKCGQKYTMEEDAEELIENFEKAHISKVNNSQ